MEKLEIVFETENIYYVKVSELLVHEYLNMVNNIEIQKCISRSIKKYSLKQELNWINDKLKENALVFSMIEKKTRNYIGNIEIFEINNNIGEIGIVITPEQQNKHFGQEALKGFINYSMKILGLDGLELNVYDFNKKAIHCYEKVGFKVTGSINENEEINMIITKEDI